MKGKKTGGRVKGVPNKATIQRAAVAERIMNEAAMSGRKLGKEVMEELMVIFLGLAGANQPPGDTPQAIEAWTKSPQEGMFEKYSKLALKAASDLADYQSPKFSPVSAPAPPPPSRGVQKKRFSVGIFDGQGRPAPRQITVKPNSSVTSAAKN